MHILASNPDTIGDVVLRQPLYRIHARHPSDFRFATEMAGEDPGVAIES